MKIEDFEIKLDAILSKKIEFDMGMMSKEKWTSLLDNLFCHARDLMEESGNDYFLHCNHKVRELAVSVGKRIRPWDYVIWKCKEGFEVELI